MGGWEGGAVGGDDDDERAAEEDAEQGERADGDGAPRGRAGAFLLGGLPSPEAAGVAE